VGINTKIEWAHHTFNPWRGCTKVSAGCDHCYAETMAKRFPERLGIWGDDGTRVVANDKYWGQPLAWDKKAGELGERHRVFCASLADVFEDRPELTEPRMRLFELIRITPNLDWLLLTKRPKNIIPSIRNASMRLDITMPLWRFLYDWHSADCAPQNVWLGTSVENQETADERISDLLDVPAAKHFLSMEPLLGPVDLTLVLDDPLGFGTIDWVIVGGESGANARPMHPMWVRQILDDCVSFRVPFFFKQWGSNAPISTASGVQKLPFGDYNVETGFGFVKKSKAEAGHILDRCIWQEVPGVKQDEEGGELCQ
jgi:protein gp37